MPIAKDQKESRMPPINESDRQTISDLLHGTMRRMVVSIQIGCYSLQSKVMVLS